MLKKSAFAAAAALPLLLSAPGANAAQVKVMVSGAMAHALEEISQDFTRKNGHTLDFVVGTTGVIQDKVRAGEQGDIIEVTSAGMDALEKEKLVVPGTRVELARALIGIAVRDGAASPNISTPEALKQSLMAARSVAYIDPKIGGQAGAAIVGLLIAISFISEIKPIKGAKVVGPLPPAVQNPSTYAAAIGAKSANPEVARALLQAMSNAESRRVITAAGLEPLTTR
jgi:molybdate transport system substrate-binding protein